MATKMCTVGGTWSYSTRQAKEAAWWQPTSTFWAFMRQQGITPVGQRPFVWSTDCGGILSLRRGGRTAGWAAAGANLMDYFESPVNPDCAGYVPIADRRIIAHSHGGNVALWAAASGLKIHTLITVGTPIRKDMEGIMDRARPNIGFWLHITDPSLWRNKMQWMGELFDGHLGVQWTAPLANLNCKTPNIGHSDIIYDPEKFPLWLDNGWLDILRRT